MHVNNKDTLMKGGSCWPSTVVPAAGQLYPQLMESPFFSATSPAAFASVGGIRISLPATDPKQLFGNSYSFSYENSLLVERFKTKPCRNYEEKGVCPYEHRCMFAHGPHEARTAEMNIRDGLFTEEAIKSFKRAQRVSLGLCGQSLRQGLSNPHVSPPPPYCAHNGDVIDTAGARYVGSLKADGTTHSVVLAASLCEARERGPTNISNPTNTSIVNPPVFDAAGVGTTQKSDGINLPQQQPLLHTTRDDCTDGDNSKNKPQFLKGEIGVDTENTKNEGEGDYESEDEYELVQVYEEIEEEVEGCGCGDNCDCGCNWCGVRGFGEDEGEIGVASGAMPTFLNASLHFN